MPAGGWRVLSPSGTKAREHRVFAGKLVKRQLGFGEKAMVVALRVPEGDFRDWAEIKGWASEIAHSLRSSICTQPPKW